MGANVVVDVTMLVVDDEAVEIEDSGDELSVGC
jgi:hypothetical protein